MHKPLCLYVTFTEEKTDKFPHSLHFLTSSYLLSIKTSPPPHRSPHQHLLQARVSHDGCLLTRPASHCLYLCLSLRDLNTQPGSHCSLCIALRLLPGGALSGSGLMCVCVCVCMPGFVKHVPRMCLFGETFCFCSLLSVLNSQAVLCAPVFILFGLSIPLLHGKHVSLSPGVFCFGLRANVCER